MLNIVWGFCFDCSYGTTYSTKCFGECEQFGDCEKGVAWTFDEDLNKFKCFNSHANEAFINTKATSEHTCNSSIVCLWNGPQFDVLKNLTSFLESLTIACTMKLWWAMKFEESRNNWKFWKEMGEGSQMWMGCSGTIPYAICKPRNNCRQNLLNTSFHNFWSFLSGVKWLTLHVSKNWIIMINYINFLGQLTGMEEFELIKNYEILTLKMTMMKKGWMYPKGVTMEQTWRAHAIISPYNPFLFFHYEFYINLKKFLACWRLRLGEDVFCKSFVSPSHVRYEAIKARTQGVPMQKSIENFKMHNLDVIDYIKENDMFIKNNEKKMIIIEARERITMKVKKMKVKKIGS